MKGSSQILLLVFFCLSLFSALLASTFISDAVFGHQVVNERRLLQADKPCPVNMENQNYTIITSRCKGPNYSPIPCCDAFKDFACPIADYINDLTTNCAKVMFSYINKIGQYPAGLFGSLCREGKEGLPCPAPPPSPSPPSTRHNDNTRPWILSLQLLTLLLLSLYLVM